MTRLLAPDSFGVLAITIIVMVALEMFSDFGFQPSIIRSSRGNDPAFLNTVWTTQILRGVCLCLLAFCVAFILTLVQWLKLAPQAGVYADPDLPLVIAILSFGLVISGFNSTKLFEASRGLALARLTFIDIGAQLAAFAVTLAWALNDPSIWALVAGTICWGIVRMALSHVCLPGTPNRWRWDASAFREIFQFGKWIFFSSVLFFVVSNSDRILLGGIVNTPTLGIYVIAFTIVSSVEAVIMKMIGSVAFPVLAETARERHESLRAHYYRMHRVVAAFTLVCAGILLVSGKPIIGLLYDVRYAEAGWMLQTLAIGLLAVPYQMATQCFIALGEPKLHSIVLVIRLCALLVLLPIGFALSGLVGALFGLVLSQLIAAPVIITLSLKRKLFDIRQELLVLPALLVGMGAGFLLNYCIEALAVKLLW